MTGDRLALATRTRKARRSSTCPACREPIHVSQMIARLVSPPAWVHVRCVPAVAAVLAAAYDRPGDGRINVCPDLPGGSKEGNQHGRSKDVRVQGQMG